MNRRHRGILLVALLAGLATLWLHLYSRHQHDAATRAGERPELTIVKPQWRDFDDQGRLTRVMRAERLEKWPAESSARLLEPRLELIDDRGQRWEAGARGGRLAESSHSLQLEHDVKLQREPQPGGLVVTTEALQIDGSGGLIETDRPVVITSGNWHFTATGLRAEPGTRRLQLLENVRGIHE